MQAVILAGGKGTRLLPFTHVFPKPLVPLGEKPILDTILRQLKHFGFTHSHPRGGIHGRDDSDVCQPWRAVWSRHYV